MVEYYITLGINIIVGVSTMIIVRYVIPLLKLWYETRVDDKIKKIIKEAVETAEQTIKGTGKGTIKKEKVMGDILDYLENKGYKIDNNILNNAIESAVFVMNNSKEKKDA